MTCFVQVGRCRRDNLAMPSSHVWPCLRVLGLKLGPMEVDYRSFRCWWWSSAGSCTRSRKAWCCEWPWFGSYYFLMLGRAARHRRICRLVLGESRPQEECMAEAWKWLDEILSDELRELIVEVYRIYDRKTRSEDLTIDQRKVSTIRRLTGGAKSTKIRD